MKTKLGTIIIIILAISMLGSTKESKIFSPVIDEINLLPVEENENLSRIIMNIKNDIGSEIVVLIIDSTMDKSIEEYSIDKCEALKIGRKEYDDGILITLAIEDRATRIEVGYGLEKIIKDEIAAEIIQNKMVEPFKNENYYKGLENAVNELSHLLYQNINLIGDKEGIKVY